MIDTIGKFFGSFLRTERNNDYQSKYNRYMEKLNNSENTNEKVKIVKNILSVIIDYLNFDEAIQSIETDHEAQDNSNIEEIYNLLAYETNLHIDEVIFEKVHPDDMKYYENKKIRKEGPISIEVNELPILLNPWNSDRIIRNLDDINDQNVFDGDKHSFNIYNHYLYPMDIVICNGGNHSQFSARMKHQGHTLIKSIRDYSVLYNHIYFDGQEFKRKSDESVIDLEYDTKLVFYSGVIFEYGRHLLEADYHRFE